MTFFYEVKTSKSVDEAVQAVESALAERKFSVLWQLNVNDKMTEKGLDFAPAVRILEVCSAPRAKEAIETNPNVAYFLPCKMVVSNHDGQTSIGVAKPTMLMDVLGDDRLSGLAREVEEVLVAAAEAAK